MCGRGDGFGQSHDVVWQDKNQARTLDRDPRPCVCKTYEKENKANGKSETNQRRLLCRIFLGFSHDERMR